MFRRDDSLSAWQTGILLFVLMLANKILVLPSLLFQSVKSLSIVVFVVLFALEFFVVFLFFVLKKRYPSDNFFDLVKNRFGKSFFAFFCVGLSIFFFAKCVLLYNIVLLFLRSVMYRKGAGILFLICFLPVVNFLAFSGVKPLGRTMQIFFPLVVVVLLICAIVGCLEIKGNMLFSGVQFGTFLSNMFKYVGPFGDSIFLFIITDKVKIKKGQWKTVFGLSIFGMFLAFSIFLVYVLTYSNTAFLHPFAIFEMLSFVKEYEGIGRLDVVPVVVVMFLTFFQLAVYLKAIIISTQSLAPKIDKKLCITVFDILFVFLVRFFVPNLSNTLWYAERIMPFLSVLPFVILPVCVMSVWRKRE